MTRTSIAAWALILAVCGCQSTPTPTSPAEDFEPLDQQAPESPTALLEAAEDARGGRRARLYLQAAEGFFTAGDGRAAAAALDAVTVERLNAGGEARYLLLRARLDIRGRNLEQARAALLALDESRLPDPLEAALVRADLLAAEGAPRAAAEQLMAYRAESPTPEVRQRLSDAVWTYLGKVPPLDVVAAERGASGSARGWWQLKALMFQSFTLTEQRQRLAAWQAARPDHPAARHPPAALAALHGGDLLPVTRVGLMLPLSGNLSRAGRAVRDAFIATYLSHRDQIDFEVTVYDTAAEPIAALYERALVNGADVLVGPLAKENVAALNGLNPEIPVLALNYLGDEVPTANLLQLGLAIEDEAATLARWLEDARVDRLLVLHNDEDWAQRARRTLTASWRGPLTVQALEDIRTVTESVGVAMHVAASADRHDELEQLLGTDLEFLPRARGDVDAILALVTQLEASALVPALKFHFADQVPVYATSQTVRGASPERLRELAGFHVAELPWFALDTPSFRSLDDAFDLQGSPFAALYALGVDAFRLAERAPLILDGGLTELLGSTGELEFASDGRIRRRLARAVISDGAVRSSTTAAGR
jgi:outer membrane PBP1 activator LpoA protein